MNEEQEYTLTTLGIERNSTIYRTTSRMVRLVNYLLSTREYVYLINGDKRVRIMKARSSKGILKVQSLATGKWLDVDSKSSIQWVKQ